MTTKKATIKDVAKEANVSISVVSYVLNHSAAKSISEETQHRVNAAAEKLHYVPNRMAAGMRRRKSLSIGIASYWNIDGTVFNDMLSGISAVTSENDYSVVLCNMKNGEGYPYLENYFNGTIDGIIFIAPYEALGSIDEVSHIQKMKNARVPFVMINGHSHQEDVYYINIDFYGSAFLATNYLIGKGLREITYVAPLDLSYTEYQQRFLGYCDAMRQNRLEIRSCDVGRISENLRSFKAIVADKSDTAHLVMSQALDQKISIPAQLKVIACNTESYSAFLYPPLSTVSIPSKEMGALAAKILLEKIAGAIIPVVDLKPACSLQIRKSC